MRHYFSVALLCLACVCILTGCKKGNDKESPTPVIDNPLTESPLPEASHTVTWVTYYYPAITKDAQDRINRILYEKGLDCRIDFIRPNYTTPENYVTWLENYETSSPLDIINTESWPMGDDGVSSFIKKQLIPLDDYLNSEDGKKLKDSYTANEWNRVSIDGHYYAVPCAVFGDGLDLGVYLSVNEKYKDYFDGFDGTYSSLRKIYDTIGNQSLRIVLANSGEEILYGLLGYGRMQSLMYSLAERKVVSAAEVKEFPTMIKTMCADYTSGILVNEGWGQQVEGEALCYVYLAKKSSKPGFEDRLLVPDLYCSNLNCLYGVSKNSNQKELAFRILAVCCSDPEILWLLNPDSSMELIEARTELSADGGNSETSGFRSELSETQKSLLSQYVNAYSSLFSNMIKENKGGGGYLINPDYDFDSKWDIFMKEAGQVSEVTDSLNEQLQAWFEKKR